MIFITTLRRFEKFLTYTYRVNLYSQSVSTITISRRYIPFHKLTWIKKLYSTNSMKQFFFAPLRANIHSINMNVNFDDIKGSHLIHKKRIKIQIFNIPFSSSSSSSSTSLSWTQKNRVWSSEIKWNLCFNNFARPNIVS